MKQFFSANRTKTSKASNSIANIFKSHSTQRGPCIER